MDRRAILVGLTATAADIVTPVLRAQEGAPAAGAEISFDLSDIEGKRVRDSDLRGRWLLAFFGYTSCPDLCPTVLLEIAQALAQLGSAAAHVQPIFVSVDPQRDTANKLQDYVNAFDPRILPLTGTEDQLARAAKSFGVAFFKVPGSGPDDYTIAHSAIMTLVGPEGGLVTRFSSDASADQIVTTLRKLVGG
jgi:protein SCO1